MLLWGLRIRDNTKALYSVSICPVLVGIQRRHMFDSGRRHGSRQSAVLRFTSTYVSQNETVTVTKHPTLHNGTPCLRFDEAITHQATGEEPGEQRMEYSKSSEHERGDDAGACGSPSMLHTRLCRNALNAEHKPALARTS